MSILWGCRCHEQKACFSSIQFQVLDHLACCYRESVAVIIKGQHCNCQQCVTKIFMPHGVAHYKRLWQQLIAKLKATQWDRLSYSYKDYSSLVEHLQKLKLGRSNAYQLQVNHSSPWYMTGLLGPVQWVSRIMQHCTQRHLTSSRRVHSATTV